MSIEFLNLAFKAPVKPSSLKFVLVALSDFANEAGEAYPSIETLENKTSQNRKTILANIAKLIELGLARDTGERKGKTRQIPVYWINKDALRKLTASNSTKKGTVKDGELDNSTKNGPIEDDQNPNSTKNGTVPFLEGKEPKNGPVKQSQKRDTEPSVLFNHQEPLVIPSDLKFDKPVNFQREWIELEVMKDEFRKAFKAYQIKPMQRHWEFVTDRFLEYWSDNATKAAKYKKQDWVATFRNKCKQELESRAWSWAKEQKSKRIAGPAFGKPSTDNEKGESHAIEAI